MKVKIYGTETCPYCVAAADLCADKNIDFEKIDLSLEPEKRVQISEENGNYPTIPMIFVDEKFIGGFTELQAKVG